MCIGIWALNHHEYALILATNRDEYLNRPTSKAHFHSFGRETNDEEGTILSGIDLKAGGTWFGINRRGDIALLTNITETPPAIPLESRGNLVKDFLIRSPRITMADYANTLLRSDTAYPGFNLLLLSPSFTPDTHELQYHTIRLTNSGADGRIVSLEEEGSEKLNAMSNGIETGSFHSDVWEKVTKGKELLQYCLDEAPGNEDQLIENLFKSLQWKAPQPITKRAELRKAIFILPIDLKDISLKADSLYGTRLSTVLLVRHNGEIVFIEKDVFQKEPTEVLVGNSIRKFTFRVQNVDDKPVQ